MVTDTMNENGRKIEKRFSGNVRSQFDFNWEDLLCQDQSVGLKEARKRMG